MPISIRNDEVKELAMLLAERENKNPTEAIRSALQAALDEGDRKASTRKDRINAISTACAALPDIDRRPENEILGYSEDGAFIPW